MGHGGARAAGACVAAGRDRAAGLTRGAGLRGLPRSGLPGLLRPLGLL